MEAFGLGLALQSGLEEDLFSSEMNPISPFAVSGSATGAFLPPSAEAGEMQMCSAHSSRLTGFSGAPERQFKRKLVYFPKLFVYSPCIKYSFSWGKTF